MYCTTTVQYKTYNTTVKQNTVLLYALLTCLKKSPIKSYARQMFDVGIIL